MALAWKAAEQADTTELTAALARFKAKVSARRQATSGMADSIGASPDLTGTVDEFAKAMTDAHWCVLLRAGLESQAEGAYQDDADLIRAFNAATRSIAQAHSTALEQALQAFSRMGEPLQLSVWELATARYLIQTSPLSSGENELSGMAEDSSPAQGMQPGQNAIMTLLGHLTELLQPGESGNFG